MALEEILLSKLTMVAFISFMSPSKLIQLLLSQPSVSGFHHLPLSSLVVYTTAQMVLVEILTSKTIVEALIIILDTMNIVNALKLAWGRSIGLRVLTSSMVGDRLECEQQKVLLHFLSSKTNQIRKRFLSSRRWLSTKNSWEVSLLSTITKEALTEDYLNLNS